MVETIKTFVSEYRRNVLEEEIGSGRLTDTLSSRLELQLLKAYQERRFFFASQTVATPQNEGYVDISGLSKEAVIYGDIVFDVNKYYIGNRKTHGNRFSSRGRVLEFLLENAGIQFHTRKLLRIAERWEAYTTVDHNMRVLINEVEQFSRYVEILKEQESKVAVIKYMAIIHENPIR